MLYIAIALIISAVYTYIHTRIYIQLEKLEKEYQTLHHRYGNLNDRAQDYYSAIHSDDPTKIAHAEAKLLDIICPTQNKVS